MVNERSSGVGQRVVYTGVVLMALGVVGSSIYGLTTVNHGVVTNAVAVFNERGRGYVEDVLNAVKSAIRVGDALDATILTIEDQLRSGGLTPVAIEVLDSLQSTNVVQTTIDAIQEDLQRTLVDAQKAVIAVEEDVLAGTVDRLLAEYEPLAQTYNRYRFIGMYIMYSLVIVFVVMIVVHGLVRWPFMHSLSVFVFLVLMVVASALVIVHTGGMKLASDSCYNAEEYILGEVDDEVARDVLEYYFGLGDAPGGYASAYDVAEGAFDVDVRGIIDSVELTKSSVLQAIEGAGVVLTESLQSSVDSAVEQADEIVALLRRALGKLEAEAVMSGPYADIRGFVCCETVDDIGSIWLGLVLTASFGFALALCSIGPVHWLDGLPLKKWYRRYRPPPSQFT
jgi:hypothetical protein